MIFNFDSCFLVCFVTFATSIEDLRKCTSRFLDNHESSSYNELLNKPEKNDNNSTKPWHILHRDNQVMIDFNPAFNS